MRPERIIVAACLIAAAGCSEREPTANVAVAEPAADVSPPASPATESRWRKDAECYWQLPQVDGGEALEAWLSGSADGIVLSLVNSDPIEQLPVSDALDLTLRADDDPKREVAARGDHGDGDSATLLQIVIDPPQRALMDVAQRLNVLHDGKAVAELGLNGAPKSATYAACDPDGGPGVILTE